jgi:hypothetical protein
VDSTDEQRTMCQATCNGISSCEALEWGQNANAPNRVYCRLIFSNAIIPNDLQGFEFNQTGETSGVPTTVSNALNNDDSGAQCFKRIRYTELGAGHCVDCQNQQPPNCLGWQAFSSLPQCKRHCASLSACKAFEFGEDTHHQVLCRLILPNGGSCPVGFWRPQPNLPATNICKTLEVVSGHCYIEDTPPRLYGNH